jgi:hypothetical protein
MSTRRIEIAGVVVLMMGLVACAPKVTPPPPATMNSEFATTDKGAVREAEIVVQAKVQSIDQKERLVTLLLADGTTEEVRVGPDVRNLSQVKRGDTVIATYLQSVAFEVVKKGEAKLGAAAVEAAERAAPGEKPGAIGGRAVTVVADVVKLDRKRQQAVLKGPRGKTVTVDVQHPEVFDKVKVGDRVEIAYREAIAIDVQPAPKR